MIYYKSYDINDYAINNDLYLLNKVFPTWDIVPVLYTVIYS